MLFRSRSHALALPTRLARASAITILSAVLLTSTGCFGTFPLTRTVYRENKEISDVEFHQTLAFWAMTLTLVYPGAMISDVIVMNTIEFWQPEPADWEAEGAFMPTPTNRYERIEIGPKPPAPVTAPGGAVEESAEEAGIPSAPAMDAPGSMTPSSPPVPLPLPPQAPVFEEAEAGASSRTLSQSDGPGLSN